MPTLHDQLVYMAQTHSTGLVRDLFSQSYPIEQSHGFLTENLGRLPSHVSPSNKIDILAAAYVGSTAFNSIWMSRAVPTITAHLGLDGRIAAIFAALETSFSEETVENFWEDLVQPRFTPMYGNATSADRAMVRRATGGRIRSREILPEYEED